MPPPEVRTSPDDGSGPAPKDTLADEALGVVPTLPTATLPGSAVLLTTRYGMPRRKVYLDLGHARTAVACAHAKGQPARLVLCELRAVQADPDSDGEVAP